MQNRILLNILAINCTRGNLYVIHKCHSDLYLFLRPKFKIQNFSTSQKLFSVISMKKSTNWLTKSRDSSVSIALGYGLEDRGSKVRFPEGAGNFSLHHRVQNGSGAHSASYPMGTRGSFPGGKVAGVWS
jgi:hypothetical protein